MERKMELTNIEAVKALGKLGGFIGRRSDGVPGVKSIWLGLKKLYTILEFKYLLNNSG
ncbi:MAG: IS4 family transposase [bacterium]